MFAATGRVLYGFFIGSLGTTIGSALAFAIVPMAGLGDDAWKMAAALMARHIGGAVNYVAVAGVLDIAPDLVAAGLGASVLFFTHTGPHTTASAWCTPILKDFSLSRRTHVSLRRPGSLAFNHPDTPRRLSTPLLTPLMNSAPTSSLVRTITLSGGQLVQRVVLLRAVSRRVGGETAGGGRRSSE